MPAQLPQEAIDTAWAAVDLAKATRKVHARRTRKGSKQREDDIRNARERLKAAMKPLRSEIARFPYGPQTDQAEENRRTIRDASLAIQAERRQLWKMTRRSKED